jgi:scpA/B protein
MAEYIPQTDYEIKLSNFEGPLDLLLHLIKEAKVDIKDIFVSQITEQFLSYVTGMTELDMDKASEYMEMAATLLEIKSRTLLPKLEEVFEYEEDPETQLIRRLEEYKVFKEAGEKLKEHEDVNRFYKAPEPNAEDVRIVYTDFNLDAMLEAFTKLLIKADLKKRDKNKAKEIPKDIFTVADKIVFIREQLSQRKEMSFYELFGEYYTRNEVITTFQAMLELLKLQYIKVKQTGIYEDINIVYNEERGEDADEPSIEEFSEYN